ncbi:hypothetical protein HDU98_007049 [Podochytrium sp. JEL0797]|nr:hypothetical protein HDU98_007049 [Podochytrium sp. JEL0797]
MTILDDEKKIDEFIESHPDMADDAELSDAKFVEEHIEFIVPQTDDPSTPAFSFRAVFLGTVFAVILSFANTALSFRSNPFTISSTVAIIVSYPIGVFMSKVLPSGFLNPGPFSMKEHVLIYIITSVSGLPYGLDNVIVQTHPDLMDNSSITFISALAFVLVTQFLGIATFASFHKVDSAETGSKLTWSRTAVFWVAFVGMFVYEWIPEYFAPGLQAVALGCLIAGKGSGQSGQLSPFNALLGSVTSGAGFLGITFDWPFILSGNFTMPIWYNITNALGNLFFLWILTPVFYAENVFGVNKELRLSPDTPYNVLNPAVNSASLFVGNANGTKALGSKVRPSYFYNVSDDYNINMTAYNNVAPIHLTGMFSLSYASSFLTVTSALVHVGLWYGKDLYRQTTNAFRQVRDEVDALDKHVKMMEAYPDVPDMFYLVFMVIVVVAGLLVSIFTPFGMPWWGIFFNLFMVSLFVVPYGAIQAISGVPMYLNVVSEFIIGLMIPGQTVAVMAFKSWGTNNLIQALALSADLKLGQYLHIPPRAMVAAQFWGTLINSVVSVAAAWYMMFNTGRLVGAHSTDWNMINYQIFYSAGGIWGAIGPQRFFGIGSIYEGLMWCFLVGAVCPVFPWLANKYIYKSTVWHYVNFSIFFQFAGPNTYQVSIVVPLLVGLWAQVYMFNRHKEFYQKYLYVIGAAFDASAGIIALVISFMGVANISFTTHHVLNPNTANVPLDWYCYPGATFEDFDCSYYLASGTNTTGDGLFCPGVVAGN